MGAAPTLERRSRAVTGSVASVQKRQTSKAKATSYKIAVAADARHVFGRAARDIWYHVEGDALPMPLMVRLGVAPDGVYQCTGLALGLDEEAGRTIPARALRGIPLGDIAEMLPRWLFGGKTWPKPPRRSQTTSSLTRQSRLIESSRELLGYYQHGARSTPRIRLGRKPKDDVFWEQLAQDYRDAERQDPRKPMQVLAEKRKRTETLRTLKHLVAVARKKGFLEKWQPKKRPTRNVRGSARKGKAT